MEQQLLAPIALATDARFIMPLMSEKAPSWLARSEAKMAERLIKNGISAIADIADTQVALGALDRLISKGLAQLSCFTPTDAVHILGSFDIYNKKAAILGAQLLARQKDNKGQIIAKSAEALSQICLDKLSFESALKISDAAISEDDGAENTASNTPALKAALSNRTQQSRLLQHDIRLLSPIIALGASAKTHYPHIAERLNTSLVIPEYAEVAGAIGAAIGSIHQHSSITITQPQEGVFRVHLTTGIEDFQMLDEAIERAKQAATIVSEQKAAKAGATKTYTTLFEHIQRADLGAGKSLFIEAVITAKTAGSTTSNPNV
jgi:N-methylhydantoinase A/oxoprolinase/acetone carboxylase beta subunit